MTSDNNVQKKCGFCGENIPAGAGRCPYCGSILEVTFDNSYRITTPEDTAVNNVEDAKPEDAEQTQAEQNAEQVQEEQNAKVNLNTLDNARPYNNGGYVPDRRYGNDMRSQLSNGMKVFLTVIFTLIPGIGQLAGIITAIVFMNSEGDSDRKSFGVALLVACLVMFVFACISCFILVIAISTSTNQFTY